jgi:hypothetical protein
MASNSQSFAHADSVFDRIAGPAVELCNGGVRGAHLKVHLRAAPVAQASLSYLHKAPRHARSPMRRIDREFVYPAAHTVEARQLGACQPICYRRYQEQITLHEGLTLDDVLRLVPRRIVRKGAAPQIDHTRTIGVLIRAHGHVNGHSLVPARGVAYRRVA